MFDFKTHLLKCEKVITKWENFSLNYAFERKLHQKHIKNTYKLTTKET